MWTEDPDILHNGFHVAYKYLIILHTPNDNKGALNHWTGTNFVLREKWALVQKGNEINLFWLCILYQSILPITKNKKYLQNIGRMYTKEL